MYSKWTVDNAEPDSQLYTDASSFLLNIQCTRKYNECVQWQVQKPVLNSVQTREFISSIVCTLYSVPQESNSIFQPSYLET